MMRTTTLTILFSLLATFTPAFVVTAEAEDDDRSERRVVRINTRDLRYQRNQSPGELRTNYRSSSTTSSTRRYQEPSYRWHGVSGLVDSIVVDISSQQVTVFKDGKAVGVAPCSTARRGKRTPTGTFKVTQKSANHRSNLYGGWVTTASGKRVYRGTPMPHFLRLNGSAIGLHGGDLPGYPASAGCIRLPYSFARKLFPHTKYGTQVVIQH